MYINDHFSEIVAMKLNRIFIFWLLLLFLKIILKNLFGKLYTYSLPYWLLLKLWCPFECCIIIKHQSPIIRGDQTDNPFVIHHGAKRHHTPWWVIKPLSPENSPWIKRWETSFNSRPMIVHLQPLDYDYEMDSFSSLPVSRMANKVVLAKATIVAGSSLSMLLMTFYVKG